MHPSHQQGSRYLPQLDCAIVHLCLLVSEAALQLGELRIPAGPQISSSVEKPLPRPLQADPSEKEAEQAARELPAAPPVTPTIMALVAYGYKHGQGSMSKRPSRAC